MSAAQEEELAKFSRRLNDVVEKVKAQSTVKTTCWLDDEFDALEECDRCTRNNLNEFSTSTLGTNLSKNRFNNVWANESTLVHLSRNVWSTTTNNKNHQEPYCKDNTAEASSISKRSNENRENQSVTVTLSSSANDYINANFIDVRDKFHVPFVYIASQSPLANTVNDFWRMIYLYSVQSIVMLCAEVENGQEKSEKYWPEINETRLYGQLTVRTLSETLISSEVVHRQFLIRPASSHHNVQSGNYKPINKLTGNLPSTLASTKNYMEQWIVEQLQYVAWPHQSIPLTSVPLSYMMHRVGSLMGNTISPIVVHCSGGLGRSGVFIAMHIALAQFELEQLPISVFDIVLALKQARTGMVQSIEQYLFLYFAVKREMQRLVLQTRRRNTTKSLQEQEQEWLQRLNTTSQLSLTSQALSLLSAMHSNVNVSNSILGDNNAQAPINNNIPSWRSFHYSAPPLMPIPNGHTLLRTTSEQSMKHPKWSPRRLLRQVLSTSESENSKREKLNNLQMTDVVVSNVHKDSEQPQQSKQHNLHEKKSGKIGSVAKQPHNTENNDNANLLQERHTHNDNHASHTHIVHSLQPITPAAKRDLECAEFVDNKQSNNNNNEKELSNVIVNGNNKQERQNTLQYVDAKSANNSLKQITCLTNESSALHSLPVVFSSLLKPCTGNVESTNYLATHERSVIDNKLTNKSIDVEEREYQEPKVTRECAESKNAQEPVQEDNTHDMNGRHNDGKYIKCSSNNSLTETNTYISPEMICEQVIIHSKCDETLRSDFKESNSEPTIANAVQRQAVIATDNITNCEDVKQRMSHSHQTQGCIDDINSNACQNVTCTSRKKLTNAEIALL